jgi:serine protease Do
MNVKPRSLRYGVAAGLVLAAGIVTGVLLSARLDWVAPAASEVANSTRAAAPPGAPAGFSGVVKSAMPAVVNISTTRTVRGGPGGPHAPFMDDPFFRQFFGDEFFRRFQIPRERRESSLGSGVIVDAGGYIITNNHVVAKVDEIKVRLADHREFTGKVVSSDAKTDIAVVKINARDLPTIPWGDSDRLEVGDYVLAIGNPFGLNSTVTLGIVSAVGRANVGIADYEDFIQTDAAINPGNSGGALINTRGELVGINTAIFSRSGGHMGIGFAVPSNLTRTVMDSLIKKGKVVRGYLGVSITGMSPAMAKHLGIKETRGALVQEVLPGSPAAKADVQAGDVILAFNGRAIDGPAALRNTVAQTPIGKTVKVELVREGKTRTVEVKIVEQPKEMAEAGEEDEAPAESGVKSTALSGIEVRNLTPDIVRQLNLPPNTAGVVVSQVTPGSAAEQAGIEPGDVVIEINRLPVRNLADFKRLAARVGKKDSVLLRAIRNGSKTFVVIEP